MSLIPQMVAVLKIGQNKLWTGPEQPYVLKKKTIYKDNKKADMSTGQMTTG